MITLSIELVPSSCWYNNVRSNVPKKTWDVIRRRCYQEANYRCQLCGETGLTQGYKHPVECHEKWNYHEATGTQQLTGFISLCPLCHQVKHAGLTISRQGQGVVLSRLMRINKWSMQAAATYLLQAYERWERRSAKRWKLDISYLDQYTSSSDDRPVTNSTPTVQVIGQKDDKGNVAMMTNTTLNHDDQHNVQ